MTTFTFQDLTPQPQQENTMQELFTQMGKDLANHEISHQQAQQALLDNTLNISPTTEDILNNIALPQAPEPQPTLTDIINNICTQLQLLTSVISQAKAQPVEENSSSNESLHETVALVLQQSDWFKTMVREAVEDAFDMEDYAKDAVEGVVESEVESYFSNSFDASDHFDFNDAVNDAVSDQIDDAVSDKIEEALDEYMAGATISISK
jgi:hypothetical protein